MCKTGHTREQTEVKPSIKYILPSFSLISSKISHWQEMFSFSFTIYWLLYTQISKRSHFAVKSLKLLSSVWNLLEHIYSSKCNVGVCYGILLSEPFPIQKSVHIWCVVTTDNLLANSFSNNSHLTYLFLLFYFLLLPQCGCWKDWSIHNPEHCVRKNEIWRCCRYLPDCQNVKNAAASHGTDRGEQNDTHIWMCLRLYLKSYNDWMQYRLFCFVLFSTFVSWQKCVVRKEANSFCR